jgi:transcription elongation factor SPT4
MPPKRGTAVVKKAKKSDKYKIVDSDGNEVSTSSYDESPRPLSFPLVPLRATRKGAGSVKAPSQQQQNLSSDSELANELQRGSRTRQDSLNNPNEQSLLDPNLNKDAVKTAGESEAVLPSTQLRDLALQPSSNRNPESRASQNQQSLTGAIPRLLAIPQVNPSPSRQYYSTPPSQAPANDEMSGAYIPPSQHRHMRACMVCSIVRTEQQFKQHGCPNCEAFLELANNTEAIQECTSQVFEGTITVSDTTRSWVARWQRLEGYVPGVYAVQVEGVLPEEAVAAAENAGVHYQPRDGTVNEALPTET